MSISIRMDVVPVGRGSEQFEFQVPDGPPPVHPRQPTFALYKAKLSGVIRLMALIGGFCMSSVADLQGHETADPWLLTLFSVTTVLLTSMAAFVILFTAALVPFMTANEELDNVLVETGLTSRFKSHQLYFLSRLDQVIIQVTWLMASTGTVVLFTINMMLIVWIKFQNVSKIVATSGTAVISPTILLMAYFAIRFWRELLQKRLFGQDYCNSNEDDIEDDTLFALEHLRSGSVRSKGQLKRKLSDDASTVNVPP